MQTNISQNYTTDAFQYTTFYENKKFKWEIGWIILLIQTSKYETFSISRNMHSLFISQLAFQIWQPFCSYTVFLIISLVALNTFPHFSLLTTNRILWKQKVVPRYAKSSQTFTNHLPFTVSVTRYKTAHKIFLNSHRNISPSTIAASKKNLIQSVRIRTRWFR